MKVKSLTEAELVRVIRHSLRVVSAACMLGCLIGFASTLAASISRSVIFGTCMQGIRLILFELNQFYVVTEPSQAQSLAVRVG